MLEETLESVRARDRYRVLSLPLGCDFSSNDYLKFSDHPLLRQALAEALACGVPLGAGSSRLLRGTHVAHQEVEAFAADFFACQAALFFANGFQANQGLLAAISLERSAIVYDALVHASMHHGLAQGRGRHYCAAHNDLDAYEDALKRAKREGALKLWIAVEAVYSMDGDCAPLGDLCALAERFDATLIVDEAHSTGVFGPGGRGLFHAFSKRMGENAVVVHTCGKALGTAGALVCGGQTLKDFLINRCRPFIYSTAPPPLQAIAVRRALALLEEDPAPREKLHTLMGFAEKEMEKRGLIPLLPHTTGERAFHILPIVLGQDRRAVVAAEALCRQGFDVRAVRPPTVLEGTARLRLSLNAGLFQDEISALFDALTTHLNSGA